jgi:menaquinone reductase, molybdopterin-binding-like subunit
VKMGDTIEVASQHGTLRAPALVTPAIAPDVIAMPIGQGHTNFTRYATGRGANPISILAPMMVEGTGSLAWAATRVKVSRVGEGKIVMFGASMEETPASTKHR